MDIALYIYVKMIFTSIYNSYVQATVFVAYILNYSKIAHMYKVTCNTNNIRTNKVAKIRFEDAFKYKIKHLLKNMLRKCI